MSWATHDVEPYVIQRHVKRLEDRIGFRLSFMAILLGSWLPDMMTKWFVYGVQVGGYQIKADDPRQFHRSWPGMGFTHSLLYGIVFGLIVWLIFKRFGWSKGWAVGLCIGIWAHVLSDTLDSNGVMLLFPWTQRIHLDVWAYAGETGRFMDARAYFSSFGFVWDGFWIVMVLLNWRVLRADFFHEHVASDPFWGFLGRWISEAGLLAIYRIGFFYGLCRWISWFIWVHIRHDTPFSIVYGGPEWVAWITFVPLLFFGGGGCPCGCRGGVCGV